MERPPTIGSSEHTPAVTAEGLTHRYGDRTALDDVAFTIAAETISGFLGPNGGGKSTLFRILATLMPPTAGNVRLFGMDPKRQANAIRRRIGVVFQSPGLDALLTVRENLVHQGHLYGLRGSLLKRRIDESVERLSLGGRLGDRTADLSGGLRRRVEIAKALLHEPQLLLLDEPSTGLDPGARIELMGHLRHLVRDRGVTVVLTTHLMEEAEGSDHITIVDRGRIVGSGSPDAMKASISGDVIEVDTGDPDGIAAAVAEAYGTETRVVAGRVRIESAEGTELAKRILDRFGDQVRGVRVGKPGLADVFLKLAGRAMEEAEEPSVGGKKSKRRRR